MNCESRSPRLILMLMMICRFKYFSDGNIYVLFLVRENDKLIFTDGCRGYSLLY